MNTKSINLVIIVILLFLSACAAPVPEESPNQSSFVMTDPGQVSFGVALAGLGQSAAAEQIRLNGIKSGGTYLVTLADETGTMVNELEFELMKGKSFPPSESVSSYYVLATKDGKYWLKLAPKANMKESILGGFNALVQQTAELGLKKPVLRQVTIMGNTYVGYLMPYYGKTADCLMREAGNVMTDEVVALYESAYLNSVRQGLRFGVLPKDFNPGNIVKAQRPDGSYTGLVIDLEGAGSKILSEKNITWLKENMAQWGKKYNREFSLVLPPELDALILKNVEGSTVGRIITKDGFIDFAIPMMKLDSATINHVRADVTKHLLENGSIVEGMSEIETAVVPGLKVSIKKTVLEKGKNKITQTLSNNRFTGLGAFGVVLMMLPGTVDIPGWDGVTIPVSGTWDTSVTNRKFLGAVNFDSLWDQVSEYKTQLAANAGAQEFFVKDRQVEDVSISPEIRFYVEAILGEHPEEVSRSLQEDLHMSTRQARDTIQQSVMETDFPFQTSFQFSQAVPGFEGSTKSIPFWVSAYTTAPSEERTMVMWTQTVEDEFGFNFGAHGLMPVIILTDSGSGWVVSYEDTEREMVGFHMKDVTPLDNAVCTINTTKHQSIQLQCWLNRK